jgi:hypothetical protein
MTLNLRLFKKVRVSRKTVGGNKNSKSLVEKGKQVWVLLKSLP